jgi:phosphate starvation-inducible PhoH-like protein
MQPIYDALYEALGEPEAKNLLNSGKIEVCPPGFFRGRTFKKAFVILDEAQNTTPLQMLTCLTRLGEGSKLVITGDLTQSDLAVQENKKRRAGQEPFVTGLEDSLEALELDKEGTFGIVRFENTDVMRHPVVQKVLNLYARRDQIRKQKELHPDNHGNGQRNDDGNHNGFSNGSNGDHRAMFPDLPAANRHPA